MSFEDMTQTDIMIQIIENDQLESVFRLVLPVVRGSRLPFADPGKALNQGRPLLLHVPIL